jgi:uncharacterized protein
MPCASYVVRMSTDENRQLIGAIFTALAAGDTKPFGDAIAEDFAWRFPGRWSWAQDWGRTRNEVRANLLEPLMAQFASYRCRADEIIVEGNNVVVRATADATTTRGEAYPQAYCYIFRIANGRLAEVVEYCDTALVERVLTVPELRTR